MVHNKNKRPRCIKVGKGPLLEVDVDVDVNEMSPSNIFTRAVFEKQLTALHVLHTFHLFNLFVDKNADRDQNCSLDLIYFQRD